MERKRTVTVVMVMHLAAILMVGYFSGCASNTQQVSSVPRVRIRDDFAGNRTTGCSETACVPQRSYSSYEAPGSYVASKPKPASPSRVMMSSTTDSGSYATHVVQKGQTLCAIGRLYGVSYKELASINGLNDPNDLRSGQVIRVPASAATDTNTTTMIARKATTTTSRPDPAPKTEVKVVKKTEGAGSYKPVTVSAVTTTPTYAIHVVQSGENMWRIAKKYDVSVQSICSINGLNQSSELNEGDRIKIPVN